MKILQFYKYATFSLLLLNLGLIAFLLLRPPGPPNHRLPGKAIKGANSVFEFDETQRKAFRKLVDEHIEKIDGFDRNQRDLLKPYFYQHLDTNKTINEDSLLNLVLESERQKIKVTYQHFDDIKGILKPEQKANFEEFMKGALSFILNNKRKRPHPPKGKK